MAGAAEFAAALRHLAAVDRDLAALIDRLGPPPERRRPAGFAGLVRIVLAQQVSSAVAQRFWDRVSAEVVPLTPAEVAARPEAAWRRVGLSRAKIAYLRALADAVGSGRLDLDAVHALDDAAAIAALTTVKGIGRWSAEVYLLFALGRPDVWPAGDLALAVALQRAKRWRRRPDPARLERAARPWRPHRSAAAHLLWHYYARELRGVAAASRGGLQSAARGE